MASYKEIFGTNIEVLASDPANPVTGQVWYNSTSNVVKGAAATTAGAWATGGNLNTARRELGGSGTQTSSLAYGGYNGTIQSLTESYNGSTWTEVNDLNTGRLPGASTGSDNTNALMSGGNTGGGGISNVETWNGTSWTEITDLNTGRDAGAGGGTNTATLIFGGFPATGVTESWNGTSWTEVADLNTSRDALAGAGKSNTSALAFGGGAAVPITGATELWNGTSWSEDTDLSTGRQYIAGDGTTASAIAFGGGDPTYSAATEEWTGPGSPLIQTFTDS